MNNLNVLRFKKDVQMDILLCYTNFNTILKQSQKIKLYNRLIAKKYLKSVEKNDVLEQGILDCKAEIINLLENNNFDFLDDVDIKVIKNEYNDDDIVRQLLDKNYINSDQVKILIEELDKSKENSENLIRFLRISLKKDLSVVMFYI